MNVPLCRTNDDNNSKYLLGPTNVLDTVKSMTLFKPSQLLFEFGIVIFPICS